MAFYIVRGSFRNKKIKESCTGRGRKGKGGDKAGKSRDEMGTVPLYNIM